MHSDYYNQKQAIKLEFEDKLETFKREAMKKFLNEKKMLEEKLEKYKKETIKAYLEEKHKFEEKINKKKEADERNRKRRIKRYEEIKKDDERYKTFLKSQERYREKYKVIRKEKEKEKLFSSIGDCPYRVIEKNERKMYVTSDGRFFKWNGNEILGSKNPSGYVVVNFMRNSYMANRLVWMAFNGEIENGMEIDHINGDRQDNRLENLRKVTHKENCNNPITIKNYKKHNQTVNRDYLKKRLYQYTIDGKFVREWDSAKDAAKELGLSYHCIVDTCNGKQKSSGNFIWKYQM